MKKEYIASGYSEEFEMNWFLYKQDDGCYHVIIRDLYKTLYDGVTRCYFNTGVMFATIYEIMCDLDNKRK